MTKKEKKKPIFLYKYITFEQFVDMIEYERLYLTRINLWEDTHEAYPIKEFYNYINKGNRMSDEFIDTIVELERKTSYAQSWTYSKIESDALWRIYSQQKTGVKIKIKLEDLEEQIIKTFGDIKKEERLYGNILEGYIDYGVKINFEDYRCGKKDVFETSEAPFLFLKRKSFSHEAEYRFATQIYKAKVYEVIGDCENANEYKQKVGEYNSESVIYYNVPNGMIKEIILDPRAPEYFEKTFLKYCENRELNENKTKFMKSELYKMP